MRFTWLSGLDRLRLEAKGMGSLQCDHWQGTGKADMAADSANTAADSQAENTSKLLEEDSSMFVTQVDAGRTLFPLL